MRKHYPQTHSTATGKCRKIALQVFSMAIAGTLSASPVFAKCTPVEAVINPSNQSVQEVDSKGVATVVTLNGSQSRGKGGTMTYEWKQKKGGRVTLSTEALAITTFTAPEVNQHGSSLDFEMTVTGTGAGCDTVSSDTASTTINISNVDRATNRPPVAIGTVLYADNNAVNEGDLVTLDGSKSTDPDTGDILAYLWTQKVPDGGTSVTLVPDSSGKTATFIAPNVGPVGETLVFNLLVTDRGGLTNNTDIRVNVQWINTAPIAIIKNCVGPKSVNEGDVVELESGSTDTDGIATYAWTVESGPPAIDLSSSSSLEKISFVAPQLGSHQDGILPLTLMVTDIGGLTSATQCSVQINDKTAPEFSDVRNLTVEATSGLGAVVTYDPKANDAVDGKIEEIICLPASGNTFSLGAHEVTCSASDKAGNEGTAAFTVTVQDTTPPTISGSVPIVAEATSAAGAEVTFSLTASDIVDGTVAVGCTSASGMFPLGVTTVNCSATDKAGNTASDSFTVTVRDTTPPVIAQKEEMIQTGGVAGAVVNYASPATSDAVDGPGIATCTPPSGGTFSLGKTPVTCTATDKAGNSATPQSFNVWVQFPFRGFFQPVDNQPAVNSVKAGSAVPVKFSLGGDMGLSIFALGYPKWVLAATTSGNDQPITEAETVAASASGLRYDPVADQYVYVWKTDKTWTTSRQLQVKLIDGTMHMVDFSFSK